VGGACVDDAVGAALADPLGAVGVVDEPPQAKNQQHATRQHRVELIGARYHLEAFSPSFVVNRPKPTR
jgi:hypothetical protein